MSTNSRQHRVDTIERIRAFNRSWTEVLGLLDRHLLDTDHTLTEARLLFELGRSPRGVERMELRAKLDIDQSFLGRVVTRLQRGGLVTVARDSVDGRRHRLTLTTTGRAAYRDLDKRSARQIESLLAPISDDQRRSIVEAMTVITAVVRPATLGRSQVVLRSLEPGDLGWVVARHGAIYADEYDWNTDFEGLVAQIVADYQAHHRPGREDAWIATVEGARAGCVFCVERDASTAQLRILLVEPWARGLGIGAQLVDECIAFAREAGYRTMMLWTNDVLVAARKIYQAAGFVLTEEERHRSFGHDLVGQNWTLDL
ncbi:MAG TPA: helix-turn-helix domain-containing GNAT family N-acetyltransferase [Ilumatobacteraceae bacterium]|nr:helix-turn-helix domain-containing GNAT family N-acetyltransferase [Ilumatobacteraceae bacterium]